MTRIIRLLAFLAGLLPAVAAAQQVTLPANTVLGRLGVGPGPAEQIPFSVLSSKLTGAITTLNSGNGQTAPGAMSPGNTYSFGANTDTPRFAGVGLGGAAPATGLQVYNAAVTPGAGGQGSVGASSTNGGGLIGQGSVFDSYLGNNAGSVALGVTTGTQNVVLNGTLTGASISTVGTVAGSICRTSTGLFLYEAGVNCFTVSGIVVVGGKTLTVDNTLELAGTDSTKMTFPAASDTVAGLAANQTFTGADTFSGTFNCSGTCQLSGTAFGTFATQNYATPPAIGGTTPNTGAFSTLTATTPMGLSSGGTNASTAAGARAATGLNVDSYTAKGDTNYTIVSTDRTVGTSASLTAARTWTLPAASAVNAGQELLIIDMVGGVTNTNTLTISRAGSDTVNGGTSVAISVSNGAYLLKSDGVSRWTAQQLGAQATVGVSSINGQTGNPSIIPGTGISVNTSGGNISVAGTLSLNGQVSAQLVTYAPQGRLTPVSGSPIWSTDQTGITTLYYDATGMVGKQVPNYNGTNTIMLPVCAASTAGTCNTSIALGSNWAATTIFDVFGYNNSGSLGLCTVAWSNSGAGTSTRATALQSFDGFQTNSTSATCRTTNSATITCSANQCTYLGSFLTNGSTGTVDFKFGTAASGGGVACLCIYNPYNQARQVAAVLDSGATYTYTLAAYEQARASAGNQAAVVVGLSGSAITATAYAQSTNSTGGIVTAAGIGIDSTTTNSAQFQQASQNSAGNSAATTARWKGSPAAGLHNITREEYSQATGTTTWYGGSVTGIQAGLEVDMMN